MNKLPETIRISGHCKDFCKSPTCRYVWLSVGQYNQGTGFDVEEAREMVRRWNSFGGHQVCKMCLRRLDVKSDARSKNCGGDCLQCMADAGDPACVKAIAKIIKQERMSARR